MQLNQVLPTLPREFSGLTLLSTRVTQESLGYKYTMKLKMEKATSEACGMCGKVWWNCPGIADSWCRECLPRVKKCISDWYAKKAEEAKCIVTK